MARDEITHLSSDIVNEGYVIDTFGPQRKKYALVHERVLVQGTSWRDFFLSKNRVEKPVRMFLIKPRIVHSNAI